MVSVSANIDMAAVHRFNALFARIKRNTPQDLVKQTRRAAIYICQSLRPRTKKAPKRARSSEIRAQVSPNPPRYAHSNSSSRALLHRWSLTRRLGTPAAYTKDHFVYTHARRAANGRMIGKHLAAERRELVKNHGGIPRAGLARKSWGWIMKQLGGTAANDLTYRRIKGERRDPRRYVKGLFQRIIGGASATIHNALDYILDALQPGALTQAMNAAYKRLQYNIERNLEKDLSK